MVKQYGIPCLVTFVPILGVFCLVFLPKTQVCSTVFIVFVLCYATRCMRPNIVWSASMSAYAEISAIRYKGMKWFMIMYDKCTLYYHNTVIVTTYKVIYGGCLSCILGLRKLEGKCRTWMVIKIRNLLPYKLTAASNQMYKASKVTISTCDNCYPFKLLYKMGKWVVHSVFILQNAKKFVLNKIQMEKWIDNDSVQKMNDPLPREQCRGVASAHQWASAGSTLQLPSSHKCLCLLGIGNWLFLLLITPSWKVVHWVLYMDQITNKTASKIIFYIIFVFMFVIRSSL